MTTALRPLPYRPRARNDLADVGAMFGALWVLWRVYEWVWPGW